MTRATPREELAMHLAQAQTRVGTDPDAAREHVAAARRLVDCLPPTPLDACPVCGRVGPRPLVRDPERHDCGP